MSGPTWISSDMSANGDRLVAVQYGGRMYMSINGGLNWTPVTIPDLDTRAPDPNPDPNNQPFESVTVSGDGQRIVGAVQNGPLVISSNAGQNWVAGTIGGTLLTGWWRSVDSSTESSVDGMIVMAADHNGIVYRSTDGGATWSVLSVTVSGAPVSESWYRLKMSANGSVIALVGNSFGTGTAGTGIYVSRDGGASWTKPTALVADYSAIAMSADGQVITVTVSNPNPPVTPERATGRVLRSTDGGSTFAEMTMPPGDTNWRAVAMSSDGNKIAVAAGLFGTPTQPAATGQLYTSSP